METEPYSILYQDDALIAINKPAGLLTIRDGYNPALPNLAELLNHRFGKVWTVHRLDKDTSGVNLFALKAESHRLLNEQFEARTIRKQYHALLEGRPEWSELEINQPLLVNGDRRHRTIIDAWRGKNACTQIRVINRFDGFSFAAAYPNSGYTHQIRAHLAFAGFPILFDPLYASMHGRVPVWPDVPFPRLALHAFEISFRHPTTNDPLTLSAPYPPDFESMFP